VKLFRNKFVFFFQSQLKEAAGLQSLARTWFDATAIGQNIRRWRPMTESAISSEYYFTAFDGRYGAIEAETYGRRLPDADNGADFGPLKLLTLCVLVLKDRTTVTGEYACPHLADFDAEASRQIARERAVRKVASHRGSP
jgi:hypothetical protein